MDCTYSTAHTREDTAHDYVTRWGIQALTPLLNFAADWLPVFLLAWPSVSSGAILLNPWGLGLGYSDSHSCGICLLSVPRTHPVIGCSPEIISKKGQLDLWHVCLSRMGGHTKHQLVLQMCFPSVCAHAQMCVL